MRPFASAEEIDSIDLQLADADIPHDVRQPTSGLAAADEILGVAEQVGADLVVIGVRRRSPVGKLVTGSTAQQVLLDACVQRPGGQGVLSSGRAGGPRRIHHDRSVDSSRARRR